MTAKSSRTDIEEKFEVISLIPKSPASVSLNLGSLAGGLSSLYQTEESVAHGYETASLAPPLKLDSAALRTIARAVFKPGKTYRMRLTRNAVVTTSGGGALQIATNVLPSNFIEYSAVSALFQECKLMATRITYAMYSYGATPTTVIGICLSFDPSNYSSAPTFTYAVQQPGARLFNTFAGGAPRLVNSWKGDGKRPWSLVTASGTGTDPTGGVVGTWYSSLSGATTASQNVGYYLLEADYMFRNPL
jgi:hypothetical protein